MNFSEAYHVMEFIRGLAVEKTKEWEKASAAYDVAARDYYAAPFSTARKERARLKDVMDVASRAEARSFGALFAAVEMAGPEMWASLSALVSESPPIDPIDG